MLIGNFEAKLDQIKGRTALPVKFRQNWSRKIIVTMGYEGALLIVDQKSWEKLTADIVNRPFISQPARETDRFLLGNAYELDLDSQGRFVLPLQLREYANLGKKVIFVGMGNRVELWAAEKWQIQVKYLKDNISRISQKLEETGGK